jgi:hypothetical protein
VAYTIWPREMARVADQTEAEQDVLRRALLDVHPLLAAAEQGAGPATVDALVRFGTDQAKAGAEALVRIDSALDNGALAVDAYVRGDAEMAAQYARASVVFTGPRPVPPPAGGPPPPETVTGG